MNVGKRVKLFIVMLLVFTRITAQAINQSAKYQILVWGMNIGEFTVEQKTENEDVSVKAVTDVHVRMIINYRVKYVQQSFYRQGILLTSRVETLKNGRIISDTQLEKLGDKYLLNKDGESTAIGGLITYSGSLLYFNEPKQIYNLYNERNGERSSIQNIDTHTYATLDKNGNRSNVYVYQDGILMRAELIHSLAIIHLRRILQD